MSPYKRINTYWTQHRSGRRRRFSAALPWVFVFAIAAASILPLRHWVHWPFPPAADSQAARDAETIWKSAGRPDVRHAVDVIRTVDGDTFEARVHLPDGLALNTRVRLRGIDTPELKAACPQELQMAEAASDALRGLLREGAVTISNIGPDKYGGRVLADVATRKTTSVSAALLAGGHGRRYSGGHRNGWCANAGE
ncbi:thermonuclease family protein [Bradyrhizobium sp. JYMT SZCCT0428]|uniref:thermonuclease family protein n=1 Tax=Bradyrhizobium sp. JYMT SZCCT0428 TaxID=2807673 RepID=UPI001BA504E5|nr:thermonuclease family protein [Bradyrhizobium sp. JYMT SZCCT0428]